MLPLRAAAELVDWLITSADAPGGGPSVLEADPRDVFVRIAGAVEGSKGGDYHLDGMGERLVVRVLHRYLTEYAAMLQDDSEVHGF